MVRTATDSAVTQARSVMEAVEDTSPEALALVTFWLARRMLTLADERAIVPGSWYEVLSILSLASWDPARQRCLGVPEGWRALRLTSQGKHALELLAAGTDE